jgi:hypothetical protein
MTKYWPPACADFGRAYQAAMPPATVLPRTQTIHDQLLADFVWPGGWVAILLYWPRIERNVMDEFAVV